MRRPLVFAGVLFLMLMAVIQLIWPLSYPSYKEVADKSCIVFGIVQNKEYRMRDGTLQPMLRLQSVRIYGNHLLDDIKSYYPNIQFSDDIKTYHSDIQSSDDIKSYHPNIKSDSVAAMVTDSLTTFSLSQSSILNRIKKYVTSKETTSEVLVNGLDSLCLLEVQEDVLCYFDEDTAMPPIGAGVLVEGKVSTFSQATNPGEFDYAKYYHTMGLGLSVRHTNLLQMSNQQGTYGQWLYACKEILDQSASLVFDGEAEGIIKTLLLGEKGQLDGEIKSLYRRNGIIHILAISGLHITLLGMGAFGLLRKLGFGNMVSTLTSTVFMVSYGIMTGMSPSACRAILMFVLQMGAILLGRTYDMLTGLVLAAVCLVLHRPELLCYSGFLFSFGAVASLGMIAPKLKELWEHKSSKFKVLVPPTSIFLGSFPLHLYFNFSYPIISVLLNLLVLPCMPVLMISGLLAEVFGCWYILCDFRLLLTLGRIAAAPAKLILYGYEWGCKLGDLLGNLNWICGKPALWMVVIYYLFLAGLILWAKRICTMQLLMGVIVACNFLLLPTILYPEITMLDVGQGDGIYLSDHRGMDILIDGGSSSKKQVGEYQIAPFLKSRGVASLDYVFVSHPDADHCNGIMELIEETDVGGIGIARLVISAYAARYQSEELQELLQLAYEHHISVFEMGEEDTVYAGQWKFICLSPKHPVDSGEEHWDTNEASLVLYAQTRDDRMGILLTGDCEERGEALLQQNREILQQEMAGCQYLFLKVAHHGSKNSTGEAFLSWLQPDTALLSAGVKNRYGHPHEELLERLQKISCNILRTDESGAITLLSCPGGIRVKTFLND